LTFLLFMSLRENSMARINKLFEIITNTGVFSILSKFSPAMFIPRSIILTIRTKYIRCILIVLTDISIINHE